MSKTREWINGHPTQVGVYGVEDENGQLDLAVVAVDYGAIRNIFGFSYLCKIVRYYPLTTGELLARIPKPPPRLPKAHPDRYLAKVAHRIGLGDVVITSPLFVEVECQLLDDPSVRDSMSLSVLHIHPNRYAQQGTDGIWREVEAPND
jgi:hypothetical protein